MRWLKTKFAKWVITHPDEFPDELVEWAYHWYRTEL